MAHPHVTPTLRRLLGTAMLALSVLVASLAVAPSSAASATPFDDVPDGAFYADAVAWLFDAGITTGTSATRFSPDDAVTRGQMAAFLERYAQVDGEPGGHGFSDVPGHSFYDGGVSFLVARDITTGTSPTTYSPDDPVTRAQMATFLWRFSTEPRSDAPMPFADVPGDTYYTEAVRWLAAEGITTGVSPTRFDPHGVVTRGQMATFLWRLANEPTMGTPGANRTDPEHTVVAEEDDISTESDIDPLGTSELVWTGDDTPDPGDVVVVGITDATPTGFIGSVVSVDGDSVITQPATLRDAIAEVDFSSNVAVEEAPADPGALSAMAEGKRGNAFENIEASCDGGARLDVDLDFDLHAGLDLEASWDPINGVEAFVGFNAGVDVSVDATASGNVECSATLSVPGPRLRPISLWIGPVPVVLQPELSLEVEIGGSIEAQMSAGVDYSYEVRAGIRFRDGAWNTEFSTVEDSGVRLPTFSATATAGIELRGRLDVLAYGIGGPYLTLGPFIELTVENRLPWWRVDAGLRASIGASIDVFFFQDEVQFAEIDLLRFRLADSDEYGHPFPGGIGLLEALPLESVDSFYNHSCGTDVLGQVHCWGANDDGQLGNGTTLPATGRPTRVVGLAAAEEVAVGERHTCARHAGGSVSCWGQNGVGQLGNGTTVASTTPVPVNGVADAIAIDAGADTTCALLADYTLRCWGANDYGQLGDGTQTDRLEPVAVPGLDIVSDLDVGWDFMCATQATGTVQCWGRNGDGQLGDGTTASRSTPAPVLGAGMATGVATGQHHACAVLVGGGVECWGANFEGQLGDDTTADRTGPAPVVDLGAVESVTAGRYHTCAEVSGDRIRCWGSDVWGQLGDADAPLSLRPTEVDLSELKGTDTASLTAGGVHTCAAMATNRVTCWGANYDGQLGDDTAADRTRPSSVVVPPE